MTGTSFSRSPYKRKKSPRQLPGALVLCQDLADSFQHGCSIAAGALQLGRDVLGQFFRCLLGLGLAIVQDGAVGRVFEVDPTCAAFQFAPAILHLCDGEDAFAGLALDGVAHARTLAIVQVVDDDPDRKGHGREAADGLLGAGTQLGIDRFRDGTVALIEIVARAGLTVLAVRRTSQTAA